jgi:hypothetical protein
MHDILFPACTHAHIQKHARMHARVHTHTQTHTYRCPPAHAQTHVHTTQSYSPVSPMHWPKACPPAQGNCTSELLACRTCTCFLCLLQVRDWALQAAPHVYAPLSPSTEAQRRQRPSQAAESAGVAIVVDSGVGVWPGGSGGCSADQSGASGVGKNGGCSLPNGAGLSSLEGRGNIEFVQWSIVFEDELLMQRVNWAKLKGEERALEKVHRLC